MATKRLSRKYTPKRFDVQVNGLIDIAQEVSELFNDCFTDYCRRFNVKLLQEREESKVMVSLIRGSDDMDGLCAYEDSPDLLMYVNAINIQLRCPMMEDWEPSQYVSQQFMEVMCHEFVHAFQCLTGRKGMQLDFTEQETEGEGYYFNQEEMEARLLQGFYANKINPSATVGIVTKYETVFDACGTFEEEL